jgi:hypothetical protein
MRLIRLVGLMGLAADPLSRHGRLVRLPVPVAEETVEFERDLIGLYGAGDSQNRTDRRARRPPRCRSPND